MAYADRFLGQTMQNGTNGCAEAVGLMGAGGSKFLANEYNNGQFSVPGMVSDAQNSGVQVIPYDPNSVSANDAVVYGNDDHVVLGDGAGGYYGNSSSQNQVIHSGDINSMGGLQPTKIIKTGGNNGGFNFQAKDASGNPFINLQAFIRTSNPDEQFDQQSIMDIVNRPQGSYAHQHMMDYLTKPDYNIENLEMPEDVAKYVQPTSTNIMNNRDADLKARIEADNANQKTQQAVRLAQLINGSNSVDNRRGYAALGKMIGINMPDGADQYANSGQLLQTQIAMNNNERNYNLQQEKLKQDKEMKEKELQLKKEIADQQMAARAAAMSGGGGRSSGRGGSSSGGGISTSQALSLMKARDEYAKAHSGEYNPYDDLGNYGEAVLDAATGNALDPDDYGSALHDWTNILAQNMTNMEHGSEGESKDGLAQMAYATYGDLAQDIINGTDWSKWDL